MIWKECSGTVSSPSLMRTVCLVCLTVAAVGGMGYWVYRMGIPAFQEVLDYGYGSTGTQAARDALSDGLRYLTACLYVLMALLLGAGAATGITMEREKDAWTSLTVTPLEGQEILIGKILGALWRVRGILAALLFVWLIGLICGAVHPLGFLLAIVATSIDLTFIAVLGTYVSLRSKQLGAGYRGDHRDSRVSEWWLSVLLHAGHERARKYSLHGGGHSDDRDCRTVFFQRPREFFRSSTPGPARQLSS